MQKDELNRKIAFHGLWLKTDGKDGERADLSYVNLSRANLTGADLSGANLTGTNIDYISWPLWCGSLNVKVDKSIASQLFYHTCALDCDDPEYQELRKLCLDFANKFNRPGTQKLE